MNINNIYYKLIVVIKKSLILAHSKYNFGLLAGRSIKRSIGLKNQFKLNKIIKRYYNNIITPTKTKKKILINSIDINLLKKENIPFYKHLFGDICYLLISFNNWIKKNHSNYKRFFINMFKILNKYAYHVKIRNVKNITHIKISNIVSYNVFIYNLCLNFNNTFLEITKNNETMPKNRSLTNQNKLIYTKFHDSVQDDVYKLISYKKPIRLKNSNMKTNKIIKRNYFISLNNYMEDPFGGSSLNYSVEEPEENTLLHKIAGLPLALIKPELINAAIKGNNNVSFCGNIALRTVPIATSLIVKNLGLPFGNAIMIVQSILLRMLARRLTGNLQYGALDLLQDTYRCIQLCRTVNTNVQNTYKWGKSWYNWAAAYGAYFKSFLYTTRTFVPRETGNQLALSASDVQGYKQIIYKNEPYHLTESNYEVFSKFRDQLTTEKCEILLKTLNHQDTFTDNLARQYLNMTTIKTKLPLNNQNLMNTPKINNEVATNTVEYFPQRLNVTNKEDAINIAEKIKNTQININKVNQQPDILLQPETAQEMSWLGKIIIGIGSAIIIFFCYKYYKDHQEWFSTSISDVKIKLNHFLFGPNQNKIVDVSDLDEKTPKLYDITNENFKNEDLLQTCLDGTKIYKTQHHDLILVVKDNKYFTHDLKGDSLNNYIEYLFKTTIKPNVDVSSSNVNTDISNTNLYPNIESHNNGIFSNLIKKTKTYYNEYFTKNSENFNPSAPNYNTDDLKRDFSDSESYDEIVYNTNVNNSSNPELNNFIKEMSEDLNVHPKDIINKKDEIINSINTSNVNNTKNFIENMKDFMNL